MLIQKKITKHKPTLSWVSLLNTFKGVNQNNHWVCTVCHDCILQGHIHVVH